MRFNLVHVLSDPPLHTPMGYRETIETLEWGLKELGHDVTVQVNGLTPGRRHMVIGAQLLPTDLLDRFPDDTILYNLEQLAQLEPGELKPVFQSAARRLQVWDYRLGNIGLLRRLDPIKPP